MNTTPASENLDAIVERAAELFHNHRRGHYGFKPWAEADAAQKNHARALMLRTAKHVLDAAAELERSDLDAEPEYQAVCGSFDCRAPECKPKGQS